MYSIGIVVSCLVKVSYSELPLRNGNVLSYNVLCSEGFVWCREVVCADVTQIVVLVSHVNAGWTAVLGGAVTQSKVKVLLYKLK